MLDEGIFDGVDMALIMHPSDMSMADDISFAAVNKTYTFTGKPAHTAAWSVDGGQRVKRSSPDVPCGRFPETSF